MVKKLEIVSDGTPEGTIIKINDETISVSSILFAIAADDIVATLQIEPTFDISGGKNG